MDKDRIEYIKKAYKSKDGKELTDKEAVDLDLWLRNFANLLIDHAQTHFKREKKLEQNPKGFELENGNYYTCPICARTMEGVSFWYDKNGIKCRDCQTMLDKKVIPLKVLRHRDCWLADWQVCDKLKIHPATRDKMTRQQELKPRSLTDTYAKVYFKVYLKTENPVLMNY